MVLLEALSISLVEAISGAIYNGYMNSKDYPKKLCNPPGLLWLSDFLSLSELVPLRLLATISSSNHESIKRITKKTDGLPPTLEGVKKINITNLSNISGSNDGNFVFNVQIFVNGEKDKQLKCTCSRTKKQLLRLLEGNSFVGSLDKDTHSLVVKFKDTTYDKKEKELLQSIIDKLHAQHIHLSEHPFCHFIGFCPCKENNDPLHPQIISFDVGVLSTHQRLALDLNGYSLALFLIIVLRTTYLNCIDVSNELNISGISLMISLLLFMTFDVIGRAQRREYLKNIEALMRWTRLVPIFSLFMILESGLMPLLFFFLVILLRATFDAIRTLYRIGMMDPSLRNSNSVRSVAQIVFMIVVLPFISRLINILSNHNK